LQKAKYEAIPSVIIFTKDGSPIAQLFGLSVSTDNVRDAKMHIPNARNGISKSTIRQNHDTHIL
jgi:hypothetical protein